MSAKPTPDPGFWRGVAAGALAVSPLWFGIILWIIVACGLSGCAWNGPPAEDNDPPNPLVSPWPKGAVVETLRVVGVREADQARQIAVRALSRDAPVDQIIQLSMLIAEYPWIGELLDDRITQGVFLPGGPVFGFPADIELDWWNRISVERSGNTLVLRRRPTLDAITYDALLRAGETEKAEAWKNDRRRWETGQ